MSSYLIGSGEPRMVIQQLGERERGPHAWRAWVEHGLIRYEREWGTYAWSRKGAEKKARRLLRRYLATRPGPETEVQP